MATSPKEKPVRVVGMDCDGCEVGSDCSAVNWWQISVLDIRRIVAFFRSNQIKKPLPVKGKGSCETNGFPSADVKPILLQAARRPG